ncbi:MAG: ABC transporter ATP-binding protein [Candidatus Hydrogenedentes bacterium]|nr:ABC transporter ATP-binding protein [Candidatus Hydrogenedentota bacterium]
MAVLEVNDLKKGFVSPDGERTLIVDIPRFTVEVAEQTALQGSSGSGKTTFLNLIAGILQADSGAIILDGQNFTALSEAGRDRLRAQSIGYVFQTFNLLQGYTALENVLLGMMFGRGADATYAKALLERVGLEDRMNYRPRQLSVGQQQRVAVARALANHPKIVLADEPTGNLDVHHANEALNLIREVCREQNAALLLVTHDRDILGQFEKVQSLADINRAVGSAAI